MTPSNNITGLFYTRYYDAFLVIRSQEVSGKRGLKCFMNRSLKPQTEVFKDTGEHMPLECVLDSSDMQPTAASII